MKFVFGDIVVVEGYLIGVVVKCWINVNGRSYEVYVRNINAIQEYREDEIQRYLVRHKELDDIELMYQAEAIQGE